MNISIAKSVKIKVPDYKRTVWQRMKDNWVSYALMAPFLVLFTVFTVIPVLSSVFLSFSYFNMLEFPKWRGWMNYQQLFLSDDVFLIAVKNTLIFAFITGPVSYLLCFFFAWFINELPPKIRSFITLVFYAPSISGNIYFIWMYIFSGDIYGMANGFLMKWGITTEPIQWLTDENYMLGVVILVQLWLSLGASFLTFIAGFQTVDNTLYEAGAIDGIRNRWQELWYITIPYMKPMMMFGAVLQIAASFAAGGVSEALTGLGSSDYATHTVVLHMKDYGLIRYEMGYASAIAVVLFISMIVTKRIISAILKPE